MSTPIRLLVLGASLLCLPSLHRLQAQSGTPGGEYYIHGIFNPTIADVRKIDLRPEPVDSTPPEKVMSYSVVPTRFDLPPRADSIQPAKLNVVQANERLYRGLVKAGYGLYNTALGELYYDQVRARDNGYGIHLKHFSSQGGINDVGPSAYSFNHVDAFYKKLVGQHEIRLRADYDRYGVNRYGYDPTVFDTLDVPQPSNTVLRQTYNDLGFAARVKSIYRDSSRLAHDVRLDARYFTGRSGSRETNIRLQAEAGQRVGAETYGARLLIDNNAFRAVPPRNEATFSQNGTLIALTPFVSTQGDKYKVTIGASLVVDALTRTTFHFYPHAYASYSLFNDILVPYVGVDGERQRTSYRGITRMNPWVIDAPRLANTSKLYDLFGGIRGGLSSSLGFDVRVSYSDHKDRVLFITDGFYSFGNQFTPLYERVKVLDVSGDLTYDAGNGTRFHGRLDIFNYTMDTQAEPWNLPPYQLTLGGSYSLQEKFIVKLDALFMGKRKALAPVVVNAADLQVNGTEVVELKGFLDLYLGLEYRYTKRLSLFLDASNLSASKYERWYRYPVQRGLVLLGATYAF